MAVSKIYVGVKGGKLKRAKARPTHRQVGKNDIVEYLGPPRKAEFGQGRLLKGKKYIVESGGWMPTLRVGWHRLYVDVHQLKLIAKYGRMTAEQNRLFRTLQSDAREGRYPRPE